MKIISDSLSNECLVLPFWQKGEEGVEQAFPGKSFPVRSVLDSKDFKAGEGEVYFVYLDKGPKRLLLLGLGKPEGMTEERYRRAYASATKAANAKKIKTLTLALPENAGLRGVAEGVAFANYFFDTYKAEKRSRIEKIAFLKESKKAHEEFTRVFKIFEGVYAARDLINQNADDITPAYLAQFAEKLASKEVKVQIHDKAWMKKKGFGLLLAVAKGSAVDPALIVVEYKGNPKAKETTLVVGKGVTYDTGGLNLKPETSMGDMKSDMSGAAAALGLIVALKALKLKTNVTVVVPATENAIAAASYKQGDVQRSFLGKTIEIDNTDAEGRLILADALAWGNKEFKPSRIIDLATLTGGVVVTFAEEVTGLMSNNEALAKKLQEASERTFERVWPLPLYDEFKDLLKSDIADMKNCGPKGASSIKGGIFLKEFVGDTPWAHLDIAGTAFLDAEKRYLPKGATGVGIRLLVDFLEND